MSKRYDLVVAGENEGKRSREIANLIVESASPQERTALQTWAQYLLDIKYSNSSALTKLIKSLSLSNAAKAALPIVKIVLRRTKKHVWDNRSTTARMGMGGILVGASIFGGKNAGIAALGTAIGVPLWVVFGAGASFLNVLREELLRKNHEFDTTYTVLDAEKVDP